MFYTLPIDLQSHIYSFDNTFKDYFILCINEIRKLPTFVDYNKKNDTYHFYTDGKGFFILSDVFANNYKDALRKARNDIIFRFTEN